MTYRPLILTLASLWFFPDLISAQNGDVEGPFIVNVDTADGPIVCRIWRHVSGQTQVEGCLYGSGGEEVPASVLIELGLVEGGEEEEEEEEGDE